MSEQNLSSFIWSVADLLRGDYKQSEYGKVILPFTVLRRLDCVLDETKEAVLKEKQKREAAGLNPAPFLLKKSGQLFYNTSELDIKKLMGDQDHIKENLYAYIQGFSPEVRDIFECFDFFTQVDRLAKANLLYLIAEKFANRGESYVFTKDHLFATPSAAAKAVLGRTANGWDIWKNSSNQTLDKVKRQQAP